MAEPGEDREDGGVAKAMPDNNPQNQTGGEAKKPDPKIRTMKSDIDEYMKEAKPSLIQILTKQVEIQPQPLDTGGREFPWKTILVSVGGVAIIGVVGWIGYQYLFVPPGVQPKTPVVKKEEQVPASTIAVEKTDIITVFPNLLSFQQSLFAAAQNVERTGSFKRIVIMVRGEGGKTHHLTPRELFGILNINPPQQMGDSLVNSFFFYVYYASAGPRAIIIAPSRNIGRTFAGMLGWENSIQRDLEILFLGEKTSPVIAPFVDRTFKNIDYRHLKIGAEIGIGYFLFSAKNYLVLATSEEALQLVINRLFEAQ